MAEVTRKHRLVAYQATRGVDFPPPESIAERWVCDGKVTVPYEWMRIAQALADIEAAALAYDFAARQQFGEFANCNFPDES